jgi:NACalpha-BTF3-like transcription factor
MTELEIEKAEAEKALISTSGDFKEALFNLIMN